MTFKFCLMPNFRIRQTPQHTNQSQQNVSDLAGHTVVELQIPLCLFLLNKSVFTLRLASADELLHHGLDADKGLLADGLYLAGGQEEAVTAGVGQLDGVAVGDAERAQRPVVAPACRGPEELGRRPHRVPVTEDFKILGLLILYLMWIKIDHDH